jgi:hypothetical protein
MEDRVDMGLIGMGIAEQNHSTRFWKIIAWLADVTLTYHNQHPEKNEFKMLAQLM